MADAVTQRRVPAVTRAVAILRALAASPEPLGVNPLARSLGLVPSTCLHILRVLVDEGLVEVDPATKRYAIGVGVLPIARGAMQRNDFASLAQPSLTALSEAHGVTAVATQVAGGAMVVVALSEARLPFRLAVELGSRYPALISATGRCVAAFGEADPKTLRPEFEKLRWDDAPSFDDWLDEIEETRSNGYAVDRGAYIAGLTIVAVPVPGPVARSIVAIDITERMAKDGVKRLGEELLRVRDRLAESLI